jgi:hypothetical protein
MMSDKVKSLLIMGSGLLLGSVLSIKFMDLESSWAVGYVTGITGIAFLSLFEKKK